MKRDIYKSQARSTPCVEYSPCPQQFDIVTVVIQKKQREKSGANQLTAERGRAEAGLHGENKYWHNITEQTNYTDINSIVSIYI